MTRRHSRQRGAVLVYVGLFLVVIVGFTAIGIDVARLAYVAAEVQSVADAAARAGAVALMESGGDPGTGIDRAQQIAGLNVMNLDAAPEADVLVDEGHYNIATGRFECCTSPANTPCCQDGSWGELECVDADAGDCGDGVSAVLAIPRTTVDNLFAGVFDGIVGGRFAVAAVDNSNATTVVQKLAVAAPSGPAAGCRVPEGCTADDWQCLCSNGVAPCLPIAAPSCQFPPACNGDGCQLPNLQVSNDGIDTAAWTGYQSGANSNVIRNFMNQSPCDPNGQDSDVPAQSVDDAIDVTNGGNGGGQGGGGGSSQGSTSFGMAQCLWENQLGCSLDSNGNITSGPGTIFQIPIFDLTGGCGTPMNGNYDIVGFATINITNVVFNDNTRRIDIQTVATNTNPDQQAGGGCFGTNCRITMMR